jgi:SAM-dependent methyltransferase
MDAVVDIGFNDSEPAHAQDATKDQFGNFHQYYHFNPVQKRISLFSEQLQTLYASLADGDSTTYLDVGCNEGDLTLALSKFLNTHYSIGIDIDDVLITRARLKAKKRNQATAFVCGSFMGEQKHTDELLHSAVAEVGEANPQATFTLVSAFSITMWVHLWHGDKGLRLFIERLAARSSRFLLVEPQLWRSYKTCMRRRKKAKQTRLDGYDTLQHRVGVHFKIQEWITEMGFSLLVDFGTTHWNRPIWLFERNEFQPAKNKMDCKQSTASEYAPLL